MRNKYVIIVLFSLILLICTEKTFAQDKPSSLIVVFVPGLSFEDFETNAYLHEFSNNSYLGLMNTYAHKTKNIDNAYKLVSPNYPGIIPNQLQQLLLDNNIPFILLKHHANNYEYLLARIEDFLNNNKVGIAFLDLDDLHEFSIEERNLILSRLVFYLEKIFVLGDKKNSSVLLLSPYPSKNDLQKKALMTPILYHEPSHNTGFLSSSSTRQTGLSIIYDIPVTILSYFAISYEHDFIGSTLQPIEFNNSYLYLHEKYDQILANNKQRPILLKGFVLIQIILVLVGMFVVFIKHPLQLYIHKILISYSSLPLLFLLMPLLPTNELIYRLIFLLLGLIFCIKLSFLIKNSLNFLTYIYSLTTFSVLLDIFNQSYLMKMSLLGYDPISGARFYGIGNEYMGVLLGASIMSVSLIMEVFTTKRTSFLAHRLIISILALILAAIAIVVALPQLGTNVGGGIAFCTTYVFYFFLLNNSSISVKKIISAGSICFLCLSILFFYDLQRPIETQSHIGLTARLIKESGLKSIIPTITRKLSMNIKLIHYSIWSRVFITLLSAMALLFYKPPGLVSNILLKYPNLKNGFLAGVFGSIVVLLVNDSGVVAAATSMIYVCPLFLHMVMLDNRNN